VTLTWLGRAFIYLASIAFVVGVIDQLWAIRRHRRSHALALVVVGIVGVVGAVAVMQFALITHNFSLLYVEQNNATFTPLLYSITGMWSALEGSILLWALLLALLIGVVIVRFHRQGADAVVAWAQAVLFVVVAFFTLLMAGPADPFIANAHAAGSTGAGPNALLQDNPLVAIHPPLLYLGFVGFTIPFAFAVAMLITGRVDERWPLVLRRWTILSWGALSVGIVLGAWWSYQVLGWGGFWGWDPVENAALLPWLTATAYIHSIVVQDRRGLFRVWNLTLAIATFALTVLGTFFTRSGVLQSVHAFSASTLGPILIGFFFLTVGGAVALLAWRGDRLRSPVGIDAPFSREGLFVANNIVFVGFAIVVLLGTTFPLLYQAINGQEVTVGTPYFASVAEPVSVLLLLLMAIAPLMSWRSSDRHVLWQRLRPIAWCALLSVAVLVVAGVRKPDVLAAYFLAVAAAGSAVRTIWGSALAARRRRERFGRFLFGPSVGGMVVHVGVVILAVGIVTSTAYTTREQVTLGPLQSTVVAGQTITFSGQRVFDTPLRSGTEIVVTVNHGVVLTPALTTFRGRASDTVDTPAIDSNLFRDVYLTLVALGGQGVTSGATVSNNLPAGSVVIGVTVEPLLSWLWFGGLMIGVGSALSFVRRGRRGDEVSA
jgi:cytochrome c-type biogenesis protein CcmF